MWIKSDASMLQWNAAPTCPHGKKRWRSFDVDVQDDIDAAYRSFKKGEGKRRVSVLIRGAVYTLNFEEMVQKNEATSYTRALRWHPNDQDDDVTVEKYDAMQWGAMQWDASSGNARTRKWRSFPEEVQPLIDAAFRRHKGEGAIGVRIGEQEYRLNFDTMTQQNMKTGFCRKLKWAERPKSDGAPAGADAGHRNLAIADKQPNRMWSEVSEDGETCIEIS